MQLNDWDFEVVQVRARKTEKHGKPYTAIANITITDGEPHVEGLLSIQRFTSEDKKTIGKYIKDLGYNFYIHTEYKNESKQFKRVEL